MFSKQQDNRGINHRVVEMGVSPTNKNVARVKLYNKLFDIDGAVFVISYDRGIAVPPLGEFISIETYHAENLIQRDPFAWTYDPLEAQNVVLRKQRIASGEVDEETPLMTDEMLEAAYQEMIARKEAAMMKAPDAVASTSTGKKGK